VILEIIKYPKRLLTSLMIVTFVMLATNSCTSWVDVEEPYDMNILSEGNSSYKINTKSGPMYTTDRVSATDSSVVINAILIGNERELIEPHEILFSDIESLKRDETDYLLVLGIGTTAVLAGFFFLVSTGYDP
jgi:hypothetical protein